MPRRPVPANTRKILKTEDRAGILERRRNKTPVYSTAVDEETVINTDGDPGRTIYVGSTDPTVGYTPKVGDVWVEW